MDFAWVGGTTLTFKIHAFEKSSNFLSESQLARAINIQLKIGVEDIFPSKIIRGDMAIVKCFLKYWRNREKRHHGLNKCLLGVKLLKKIPR
jgi:hypothetical protein